MTAANYYIPQFPPPSLPWIQATPIPTGGAITLAISGASSGTAILTRVASGASGVATLYNGPVIPLFLDIGDGLPQPLTSTAYYQYTYTDNSGTVTTDFIQPVSTLSINPEPITAMLIKLLQGAFNSLTLPAGVNLPEVLHAMPLGGIPMFPFVVVNQDLLQQTNAPIGQSAYSQPATSGLGTAAISPNASGLVNYPWSITGLVERTYRVSVLTKNAVERDFYRDAIPAIFQALFNPVLQPLGLDVSHRWQVSTGQVADDRNSKAPGFYFAECMLVFEGVLDITVAPIYGLVHTVSATMSAHVSGDMFNAPVGFSVAVTG